MDYLFVKLIWWIALAFVLGAVAGWASCGAKQHGDNR
jgi:hypothetical protein